MPSASQPSNTEEDTQTQEHHTQYHKIMTSRLAGTQTGQAEKTAPKEAYLEQTGALAQFLKPASAQIHTSKELSTMEEVIIFRLVVTLIWVI